MILAHENEKRKEHLTLNKDYLNLELMASIYDNFNKANHIEFKIRKKFKQPFSPLYKKVLKRLSKTKTNKDGLIELTPKLNGRLQDLYERDCFIKEEYDLIFSKIDEKRAKLDKTIEEIAFESNIPMFSDIDDRYYERDIKRQIDEVDNLLRGSNDLKSYLLKLFGKSKFKVKLNFKK